MKRLLRLRIHSLCLWLLLIQASCVKKTTVIPQDLRLLPAKTATRAELLKTLEENSKKIGTLNATVSWEVSRGGAKSGVLDEYRQTKGYVFVERPVHIRIQIQAPVLLTNIATMVSDGKEYRISIPVRNQFAIRQVDAPPEPKSSLNDLRPQMFLDGLFVDVRPYVGKPAIIPAFEEQVVGIHSFYVFSFIDTASREPQILEKIWIDRAELEVARKQVFGKDGRIETDADYQNYHRDDGIPFPEVIVIHRPVEDLTVKMTVQKKNLNDKLDPNIFILERPEGSQLLQVTK